MLFRSLHDTVWGTPSKANATLNPGANTFEIRYGQGGGGGGCPAVTGTVWWNGFNRATGFAIDFQGRNSTDTAHYTIPTPQVAADRNLFTLTAHTATDFFLAKNPKKTKPQKTSKTLRLLNLLIPTLFVLACLLYFLFLM